jgi:hypothetical protein
MGFRDRDIAGVRVRVRFKDRISANFSGRVRGTVLRLGL